MRTVIFFVLVLLLSLLAQEAQAQTRAPTHADLIVRVQKEGRVKGYIQADQVVTAAELAATPDFPIDLLLAMADIESDFDPTSVSRKVGATWDPATRKCIGGHYDMGTWHSTKAPKGICGNMFCGIMQTTASSWKQCLAMRDVNLAMRTNIQSLQAWFKRGKTVQRALQGYGCGNSGMHGGCKAYAAKVFTRSRLFSMPVVIPVLPVI